MVEFDDILWEWNFEINYSRIEKELINSFTSIINNNFYSILPLSKPSGKLFYFDYIYNSHRLNENALIL
jgi:hypothetical protein